MRALERNADGDVDKSLIPSSILNGRIQMTKRKHSLKARVNEFLNWGDCYCKFYQKLNESWPRLLCTMGKMKQKI